MRYKVLSNGEQIPHEMYANVKESLRIIADHNGYVPEVADSLCIFLLKVMPMLYVSEGISHSRDL